MQQILRRAPASGLHFHGALKRLGIAEQVNARRDCVFNVAAAVRTSATLSSMFKFLETQSVPYFPQVEDPIWREFLPTAATELRPPHAKQR